MVRTTVYLSDSQSIEVYGEENEDGEVVPVDVLDQGSGEIIPKDVWMNDPELYSRIENSIQEAV